MNSVCLKINGNIIHIYSDNVSFFFTVICKDKGEIRMKTLSETTGKYYEDEDCVFFRNTLQSAFYKFHEAELVDMFVDDKMRFVFVFTKKDHERLKMLWKNSNIEKDKVNNNG